MRWLWSKTEPAEDEIPDPTPQIPDPVWKPQVGDWMMINRCHCGYIASAYMGVSSPPDICPKCGCDWAGTNSKGRWEWEQAVIWEWVNPIKRNEKWVEWTECAHQGKTTS
jgi:hypothetical protein